MLLREEIDVIRWLTEYGPLHRLQIEGLLNGLAAQKKASILRNLLKGLRIVELPGGYLGTDTLAEANPHMVAAVWTMLHFEAKAHYPAQYPAQIYFMKEDSSYEIIVLHEHEEHLLRLLQPDEDMKYIIVLDDVIMTKKLKLPDVPCLFSVIDGAANALPPTIRFYKGERYV